MNMDWSVPTEIPTDECIHSLQFMDYLPLGISIPDEFKEVENTWVQWAQKLISGQLDT